jgi:hypothetical protein
MFEDTTNAHQQSTNAEKNAMKGAIPRPFCFIKLLSYLKVIIIISWEAQIP